MSLDPLFSAEPVVVIHALFALAALVLGLSQLVLPKGGRRHRITGWIWVGLMAIVALSSFWIHDIRTFGPFSLIHILAAATLYWLVMGVREARSGDIKAHKTGMTLLFFGALIGAGALTLLPGRLMHIVVFGQ